VVCGGEGAVNEGLKRGIRGVRGGWRGKRTQGLSLEFKRVKITRGAREKSRFRGEHCRRTITYRETVFSGGSDKVKLNREVGNVTTPGDGRAILKPLENTQLEEGRIEEGAAMND